MALLSKKIMNAANSVLGSLQQDQRAGDAASFAGRRNRRLAIPFGQVPEYLSVSIQCCESNKIAKQQCGTSSAEATCWYLCRTAK